MFLHGDGWRMDRDNGIVSLYICIDVVGKRGTSYGLVIVMVVFIRSNCPAYSAW